jgi:hypothetical protein
MRYLHATFLAIFYPPKLNAQSNQVEMAWRVDVGVNPADLPGTLRRLGTAASWNWGGWRRANGDAQFSSALPSLREFVAKPASTGDGRRGSWPNDGRKGLDGGPTGEWSNSHRPSRTCGYALASAASSTSSEGVSAFRSALASAPASLVDGPGPRAFARCGWPPNVRRRNRPPPPPQEELEALAPPPNDLTPSFASTTCPHQLRGHWGAIKAPNRLSTGGKAVGPRSSYAILTRPRGASRGDVTCTYRAFRWQPRLSRGEARG